MQKEINRFSGRVLWIDSTDALYVARRFEILRSKDRGTTWERCWKVPASGWKAKFVGVRLAARLLRQEIRTFCLLADGTGIAATKSGVFRGESGQERMDFVMKPENGIPLNIAVDKQDRVFFGDYGFIGHKRLYASFDKGRTFEEIYRFKEGDIRHVHGIQPDPYDGGYWVFVGDFDAQPGIAKLSRDLKTLDWIERSTQMVRAVKAIVEPDCLYYGTDSEFEQNYIVRLDKKTGKRESLLPISGPSLHATRFGNCRVITTSVEPSAFTEPFSTIYVSMTGNDWKPLCRHPKDRWSPKYFQYGNCVLPNNVSETSWGAYSGQALKGIDDRTVVFE